MKLQKLVLQQADSKKPEGIRGIKLSNNCNVGMLHSNYRDPLCFYGQGGHYIPAWPAVPSVKNC